VFKKARPWTLSWATSIQSTFLCLIFKIIFNIILLYTPRSPSGLFPLGFPTKNSAPRPVSVWDRRFEGQLDAHHQGSSREDFTEFSRRERSKSLKNSVLPISNTHATCPSHFTLIYMIILQCSQEPVTEICPEPDESSPHRSTLFP